MFSHGRRGELPIEAFLANPIAPILIDVRGSSDTDPAIPGSQRVYLLDIEERTEAFEKKIAPQMAKRSILIYCAKGEGSHFLVGKFSANFRVQSLQGGMVAYLTAISRLLHEHLYEDQKERGDTMVKILAALTDRETDPETFRKIMDRLLRCTPNPKFRKLVR